MDTSNYELDELGEEEGDLVEEQEISFNDDIISLQHSFGYDCKRLFNMVLIDSDTIIFASGNFLHYFSISRREVTFRETVFGCGIGFITKSDHPDHQQLFTVGENGPEPTIFIYEYPSHNIRIKLLNAAKASFTAGSYNSSGELFASQAGAPDFMITIWRWETAEVLLRAKSFQNDILFVHFSLHNPILLVSSGLSHIKFWKMAKTFTGLKLKGDLGRFGKTDFSDIYATYMLPDENVISGCHWGNMLLWEAGLIKFEICRKGRKPCHTKAITRITMDNGEVTTVGMDGYVRIWYWESVDLADPPEDDLFVEIDPIYEFKIADVEIRCLQKIELFNDKSHEYYAQDGKGGIWFCDINTLDIPKSPYQLYSCIGGRVLAAQMSPISPHLLALSQNGKIFVYNYEQRSLLLEKQFAAKGVDLLWFDTNISKFGTELVAGFEDGILRQLFLDLSQPKKPALTIVKAFKAHTAPITRLTVNQTSTLLLTGSADKSIFIYKLSQNKIDLVELQPMGFVEFNATPNCFFWMEMKNVVLIGCKSGEVYEYNIRTDVTDEETYLSYKITEPNRMRMTRFVSVKSRIRRDINREKIKQRKQRKRKRKMKEIDALKKANPGLQIDMESALADSEPDEEEPPLHIPSVPNAIIWLRYTERDTIWVSMAGYDAGYIYELQFEQTEPSACTLIADGDDIEIHSYCIIDEFLVFGMVNGKLRINQINPEKFTDLTMYRVYPMHDALKGVIPCILTSFDGEHLVSVGHDGNIFLYKWNGPKIIKHSLVSKLPAMPVFELPEDIVDPETPSLEQEKINAELKRKQDAAEAHDRSVLAQIGELQNEFFEILRLNKQVPEALRATDKDLLLDVRITKQIRDELQAELDDVREDLAYDLEFAEVGHQKLYNHFLKELDHVPFSVTPFRANIGPVCTFRLQALGEEFQQIKRDIEERLRQEKVQGLKELIAPEEKEDSVGEPGVEMFFFGRDANAIVPRFSRKMMRLLTRYRMRQLYEVRRIFDWDKLERQKPDPNRNHPDDDAKIAEAKRNLGDYKLKSGNDYEPRTDETLTGKYIEIVEIRERHFNLVDEFNQRVIALRQRKKELMEFINKKRERLRRIHDFLPEADRIYLEHINEIDMDLEYPETNLIEHFKPGCGVNIDDILYLDKTVAQLISAKKPVTIAPLQGDNQYNLESFELPELHEVIKFAALQIDKVVQTPNTFELKTMLLNMPQPSDAAYFELDENGESPMMQEMRYRWLRLLLVEQLHIRNDVDEEILLFDKAIGKLNVKRLQTKLDAEFMSAFLISLNQELYILRDSEEIENQLLHNANTAMNTRNQLQLVINATNRELDELRKNIDKLQEQIAALQLTFMSSVKGHKFFDFLRRIFKKKWRPPKRLRGDDESSSSSSESSSSTEEEGDIDSVDSLDITTIRLDETTCPTGLERPLYELAFTMRAERHEMERSMVDLQRTVDSKRKDISDMQIKMKFHEEEYGKEKNTLLEFRRNRQKEINKVQINAVLRMDQLQHFNDGDDYRDLSKAILFDAEILMDLRNRVDQLNEETLATKRWHRINFVHLRRMNTDIKFMRFEITRLEEEIKQAMMRRFGLIVKLDELEEEVLRRYVFDLETTAEEELKALEKELQERLLELARCEEELVQETQNNTDKRNMLTVLMEQQNVLDQLLDNQSRNYAKWVKPPALNLSFDIEKLMGIEKSLQEQIECLEREICALRLKSKPLQINEPDDGQELQVTSELFPNDDPIVCPTILNANAFMLPPVPDDFILDRVHTIVQKTFHHFFGKHTSAQNVRKFAHRSSLYLCQAAYNFQGKYTDRIAECITEHLESIVPKKYFIYLSAEDLRKLFNEVVAVFDYERSDVNTEELISGIFEHAKDSMCANRADIVNRTHYIVTHMFSEFIEVLPLEEFQSEETVRMIVDVLEREPMIDPRAISVEELVRSTLQHAKDNLLDGITAVPIRKMANGIQQQLSKRRQHKPAPCQTPMSVRIGTRKQGGSGLPF